MVRFFVVLTAATLLQGCCCCGFGGGGGGSGGGGGGVSSRMEEWAAEKATEKILEAATGGEMEIDASEKKFSIKTEEGKVTTWADGSLPEGFTHPLPSGATVKAGVRFDPIEEAEGRRMLGVFYEIDGPPAGQVEYWTRTLGGAGYTVRSVSVEGEAAIEKAREEGVELPPEATMAMGSNLDNAGDMLLLERGEDKAAGSVIIGNEQGKTIVYVNVFEKVAVPAEAP